MSYHRPCIDMDLALEVADEAKEDLNNNTCVTVTNLTLVFLAAYAREMQAKLAASSFVKEKKT